MSVNHTIVLSFGTHDDAEQGVLRLNAAGFGMKNLSTGARDSHSEHGA